METNIEADIFIFQSGDKDASRKFIVESALDNETKEFYYKMISFKYVTETLLTEQERFLFEEFFDGYTLKELRFQYDMSQYNMSKNSRTPRIVLSDAIFKLYVMTPDSPNIPVDELNSFLFELKMLRDFKLKHKSTGYQDLYNTIYSCNVISKNIYYFLDKHFPVIDYVYCLSSNFQKLLSRAFKALYLKPD